ncbi:heptaprenyl diphosphate synthase [Laribacter hongkongensis]|uniref:Heptaprenyl diphosphate synthase n=1 Tax=Laribacter hongkongensis TaxID=168471 RepID=A0A248LJF6_9NEIS|nr:heptaprenyl diphosphate synthase [Laribacter hongkongensis]
MPSVITTALATSTSLTLTATPADRQTARLAAIAIVLALIDAGIPSPLPGLKPGFANIVTLVALERLGLRAAVAVSLIRVFAAALLLGSLMTPGFFFSLAGGIASLATLALAHCLPRRWFGMVSLSLLAAFAHIGGQLLLARLWLIPSDGLGYFVPLFLAAAFVSGTVNGIICARLLTETRPDDAPA